MDRRLDWWMARLPDKPKSQTLFNLDGKFKKKKKRYLQWGLYKIILLSVEKYHEISIVSYDLIYRVSHESDSVGMKITKTKIVLSGNSKIIRAWLWTGQHEYRKFKSNCSSYLNMSYFFSTLATIRHLNMLTIYL